MSWRLAAGVALALVSAVGAAGTTSAAHFEQRVRPLLTARCLGCHSGADAKGGLDLSTRKALLAAGGGGVLRPTDPDGSRLVARTAAGSMPPKGRLTATEVADLRRWVQSGAPWPGGPLDPFAHTTATRAGRDWWSLQPLRRSPPPAGAEPHPVDAFIRARLRQAGLKFSPPASRPALIRRLTYDLHGLPPTWAEVQAFQADVKPGAYERLVDRLLASTHFGERMGRRWLDAVRFAESDGYEHDMPRLKAWPYRDWVIDAFNRDLPYPEFLRQQLAGDALHPTDPQAGVPTGFLMAGGFDSVGSKQASATARTEGRQDELEDMIGTTSQVMLGMTAQCARCHDHKFDPIPQADYYRLQAALAGAQHHGAEGKQDYYGVRSVPPPATHILRRGAVAAVGPEVAPGGLSAVTELSADLLPPGDGDGPRRLALARWITDVRNPLPSRVMANRVWGWLFGQGLVGTPNDFGFNGERPTHPELLDYLAARLQGPGPGSGSLKALTRLLVTSRTYRQGSVGNPPALARDAGNRLLWRHTPRRLEAEELRDSILVVAGRLNPKMGGPGFQLFTWKSNAGALYSPADPDGPEFERRAVYRMVVRGLEAPLVAAFDCPDPSATTPRRQATTTATQALTLLNNSFVDRHSRHLAERLIRESPGPLAGQIRLSYRLALGREAGAREQHEAMAHAEAHGLRAWGRVLLNTSEFLWVE